MKGVIWSALLLGLAFAAPAPDPLTTPTPSDSNGPDSGKKNWDVDVSKVRIHSSDFNFEMLM